MGQILGRDFEGGWGGRVVIVGDCWFCGFDNKKLLIFPVTLEKTTSFFKDFYEKIAICDI